MGKIDEHWCSDCKRTLDKQKDKYLDLENIRLKGMKGKKAILCEDCLKKPEYDVLRKLLKEGNPDFLPFIECGLHTICKTFKAVSSRPVRCCHIAVIDDTVYCKRRHPGTVKLPVERAERVRREQRSAIRLLRRALRTLPEDIGGPAIAMITEGVQNAWIPPSAVIKGSMPAAPIEQCQGSTEERS